jgi:multiple sugar transport system permease protein
MGAVSYDIALDRTDVAPRPAPDPSRRWKLVPTLALLAGAIYCLAPVLWVFIAATKTRAELFSTDTFLPSFHGGLTQNVSDLFAYQDGQFLRWCLNSLLYAGVGSVLSSFVSALAGYGLAKYRFRGRNLTFNILLGGVLLPQITLAIPQYLLLAKVGLAGTYWSVLLPTIISPFGIYLCRIYAAASVPTETLEAGRIDGAGELRLFRSIALPMMAPALITVFLLQFVATWNNFLLPFIMLSDGDTFPLTTGLYTMLNQGAQQPALYSLVIAGVMISIIPLIGLFLALQRYWRIDLISGGLKG